MKTERIKEIYGYLLEIIQFPGITKNEIKEVKK
jgi:hypothetical protein